ncbi:MAG: TRAP transporter large permease [Lawsonibacter sp.]|nr:TRAP transporter large permease [Lawsonibacter sp.]
MSNLPLIVFLICFILMFVLRMPIPTGMIAACTMYFLMDGLVKGNSFFGMVTGSEGQLHLVAQKSIEAIFTNQTIIAVPLFIFAANVMNAGKITEYVFGVCKGLVGRFPGGLAHVNVLASLVFSGMTGSAVADASGLGKMEIDAMRAEGYDDGFSCAITAASATIGPIFPPSIPAVIYSMLTGASVGALFMAGMMPGVILAVGLCIYIAIISSRRHYPKSMPPALGAYLRYVFKAIWALLTPVILLVGIYTGVMTPTEAGAIAGFYSLIVAILVYRILDWKGLKQVLMDTVKGTGNVSIMIGAASAISFIFAKEQIGVRLGDWIRGFTDSKVVFLLMVNVIILVLGMFVDTSVIQLVMIPILWPVAQSFGVNIIHFGLIIVFNMMLGLSTPPFGMCLFITSGISGTPLKDVIREIWAPIVVMLLVLLIITFIPQSVLFLPQMFGMM